MIRNKGVMVMDRRDNEREIESIDRVIKDQWKHLDRLVKEHEDSLMKVKREINIIRSLYRLRDEKQKAVR